MMQTISSQKQPFDDVLYHEKDIIITSARIENENIIYAMKYVSSVLLEEHHPPRTEAKFTLLATLFALCVLIVYRITEKVSATGFSIMLVGVLLGAIVAASILFLLPSRFKLEIHLVNGERVEIKSKNERKIHQIHRAITTAVALNKDGLDPNQHYHTLDLNEHTLTR